MRKSNRTQYTILGMLTVSPMSGYEIAKTIQNSTSFFWSESEGQIYPSLAECLKLGLTTCQEDSTNKTLRNKKIYSITTKGRKALITWLSEKAQPTLIRNELLLKLFFGSNTDIKESIHHVMTHEKAIQSLLKTYKDIHKDLITQEKNSPHLKFWLITLDYGLKITKAELKWCQETLTTLTS